MWWRRISECGFAAKACYTRRIASIYLRLAWRNTFGLASRVFYGLKYLSTHHPELNEIYSPPATKIVFARWHTRIYMYVRAIVCVWI